MDMTQERIKAVLRADSRKRAKDLRLAVMAGQAAQGGKEAIGIANAEVARLSQ